MVPEGRMVLVGNVSNTMAKLPLGLVILKSLQIIGSDSIESNELIQLFQFLNDKGIRPHVRNISLLCPILFLLLTYL